MRELTFGRRGQSWYVWTVLLCLSQAPTSWGQQDLVTRGYRVESEQLEATTQRIREQFPAPLVRVASDPRSGRMIVVAAESIHREIEAALLRRASPPSRGAGPTTGPPAPSPAATQQVERRIQLPEPQQQARVSLRYRKVADVQQQLQAIWGNRIGNIASGPAGEVFRLPGARGDQVEMSVDHINQQFVLSGGASSLTAWQQVISAIDQPARGNAGTSVVAPRTNGPTLQRLVSALQQGLSGTDAVRVVRMGRARAGQRAKCTVPVAKRSATR